MSQDKAAPPLGRLPRAGATDGASTQTSQLAQDEAWMDQALVMAAAAAALDEVPVGAILVRDGEVLGQGYNRPILSFDASAHAEIVALRAAGQQQRNYRFPGATLYVTVEPCTMCAGALVHARIARLVFGATEPKSGAVVSTNQVLSNTGLNHQIQVTGGVRRDACGGLLQSFFRTKRDSK